MSITQIENIDAFVIPARTTFERLEDLFIEWRRKRLDAVRKRFQLEKFDRIYSLPEDHAADRRNQIINQLTQAELRQREILDEIYNVARLLVAERDNGEMITA